MSPRIPKLWQIELPEYERSSSSKIAIARFLARAVRGKAEHIPALDRVLVYAQLSSRYLAVFKAYPHLLVEALQYVTEVANIELEFHLSPNEDSTIYICDFPAGDDK